MDLFAQCRWPDLASNYDQALRAAIRFILDRFAVSGIIASGAILRGNPGPSSDLDIYVVHAKPQRQRIQKWFHRVPAEIFINPPAAIRSYFGEERGRPCTAHMLATGFVILDRDPVMQQLRAEANIWLQRPPDLPADRLTWLCYAAADTYDNAKDIRKDDPANAGLILHKAVQAMLDYWFLAANRHQPREKELLRTLDSCHPEVAELARAYYLAPEPTARFHLAEQIALHTIHTTGFFEWESNLEEVEQ